MVLHHRIFWSEAALHDWVRMGLDLDLGFQNTNMNGFQNTHSLNKHEWVTNGGMEEMGHVSSKGCRCRWVTTEEIVPPYTLER